MEERELSPDIMEATDSNPEETTELLMQFKPGQSWKKTFRIENDPRDTRGMLKYIEALKDAGLDIGTGEAEFGFRMPLPEKNDVLRALLIFRRRIGDVIDTAPDKPNKHRNLNRGRNFRKKI